MQVDHILFRGRRGAHFRQMLTREGLLLGHGILLANMGNEGLCLDDGRAPTLLTSPMGALPTAAIRPSTARQNIGAAATRLSPPSISRANRFF